MAAQQRDWWEAGLEVLTEIPRYPTQALPTAARDLVAYAEAAGLPPALAAGAALAAQAAALGPEATLTSRLGWDERAILWNALLAPRGAGKSPCQEMAFKPLRERDELKWPSYQDQLEEWRDKPFKTRGPKPLDPTILAGDTTLEALARRLDGRGAVSIDLDELTQLLRGLGEYKRGGGGDRGRFLALWTGDPWRYSRVTADLDILIPRPTTVICGGLQTALHHLLGGEEDGLRPRWLPYLAAMPEQEPKEGYDPPVSWPKLMLELLRARPEKRSWVLRPAALREFLAWQKRWKAEARSDESASVSAALVKADVHLQRHALLVAEAANPGGGGEVDSDTIERGAAMVAFTLDGWRALPENGSLALSRKDEQLDKAVDRLREWLEQHGGRETRRELFRLHVAGVRTAADLEQLLIRYQDTYPGTLTEEQPARGPKTVIVWAPKRRPAKPNDYSSETVAGDSFSAGSNGAKRPGPEYKTEGEPPPKTTVASGDSSAGDSSSATVLGNGRQHGACPSCGLEVAGGLLPGIPAKCVDCGTSWTSFVGSGGRSEN